MKNKLLILICMLLPFISSCKDDNDDSKEYNRTVLAYIMAENSLSSYSNDDIKEMIAGMSSVDLKNNHLILYIDDYDKPRIVEITKVDGTIQQKTVYTYEEQLSNTVDVMTAVYKKVFKDYPAKSYGLILWSHGDGWLPYPTTKSAASTEYRRTAKSFGQDGGTNGSFMDILDLKKAVSNAVTYTGKKFDFIMFDACCMQCAEVLYEMKDCMHYSIASQYETPAFGAPYTEVIPYMFTEDFNAVNLCKAYFAVYSSKYKNDKSWPDGWPYGAEISAVDCTQLSNLAQVSASLLPKYKTQIAALDLDNIQVSGAINIYKNNIWDIDDFMKNILSSIDYTTWSAALSSAVVCHYATATCCNIGYESYPINVDSGLGCYIPHTSSYNVSVYEYWNTYIKKYAWNVDAGWSSIGW